MFNKSVSKSSPLTSLQGIEVPAKMHDGAGYNPIRTPVTTRNLPTPQELEHYDKVVPGSAEKIFSAFMHREQINETIIKHDHEMDKDEIKIRDQSEKRYYKALARGQFMVLGLSVLCVMAAIGVTIYGASWMVSVSFLGIPMLHTVRTLMKVPRDRKEETKVTYITPK